MPFKIIMTMEKWKPGLCVVPSQWENGGIVQMPQNGAERLSRDEDLMPRATWLKIECMVKRRNISSYEEAESELQDMLDKTFSESEEPQTSFQRPTFKRQRREIVNIDILDEPLSVRDYGTTGNVYRNSSEAQRRRDNYNFPSQAPTRSLQDSNLQHILENQSLLFDITNEILQNQKKIMQRLTNLSVQIEDSIPKIASPKNPTVIAQDVSSTGLNSYGFKQVKNVQDLDELEALLSDKETKEKIKKATSIICSGGIGYGMNCAYRFVDVLFSRDFMCECSWSGGSRKDDGVKISFKCYKNILNFFFEVVHNWDSTYSQETNEDFFKRILRNSLKRKTVMFKRTPAQKRRRAKILRNIKDEKTDEPDMILENEDDVIETNNVFYIDSIYEVKSINQNEEETKEDEKEEEEEEESLC